MTHTIRLDVSEYLVVVCCSCGWRDDAPDRQRGNRLAQIHATFVHRDETLAEDFRLRASRIQNNRGQLRT